MSDPTPSHQKVEGKVAFYLGKNIVWNTGIENGGKAWIGTLAAVIKDKFC